MKDKDDIRCVTEPTAAHLRAAIAFVGLEHRDAAAKIGLGKSTLHKYEKEGVENAHIQSIKKIRAFLETYGITLYESDDSYGVWIKKSAIPANPETARTPDESPG